ncbi:MAG: hypothetical protein K6C68_08890 [Ruminococcus sp.]|nr:hypothetical protein [Ruminococcus sp.]
MAATSIADKLAQLEKKIGKLKERKTNRPKRKSPRKSLAERFRELAVIQFQ